MSRPCCPLCKQEDQVEKVSTIYIEGLRYGGQLHKAGIPGEAPLTLTCLSLAEARQLSSHIAPPAAPTKVQVRPVHPDLVVAGFTAILPIFLLGIANSQPQELIPLLVFLGLVYILYFLTRGRTLARFAELQSQRVAETKRVERAIRNWMELYYCVRDQIVFLPKSSRTASIEEMGKVLFSQ